MQHKERELTGPVRLSNPDGTLNPEAIGFSRNPIITGNLAKNYMRKKRWNYWCVYSEDVLFSVTVSHLDYAASCFVYVFNYETQRFFEKTVTVPLGRNVRMGDEVLGNVSFTHPDMNIQMIHIKGETHLLVTVPDFDGDLLHADLHISHPEGEESLNVVVPWNRNQYQFTAKHHLLPAEGFVTIDDRRFRIGREESFAVLDFGRGIWPRKATWNWAMASQQYGRRRIGLNFGGQWTDGTGMTENAVFIDGKMYKISEDVLFDYDPDDYMKTWKIRTKFTDSVDLTFTPFFERTAETDAKLVKSEVHQMFGYFRGRIRLPDAGVNLHLVKLLGCSEEHRATW
ncbi:Protein of unknown function [Bhargavaea ginsengi]|uniref:DUF2804 domain-containing protein n=1 Tax=Bhargavaea ginsengi TaxID=426757 RepID=A0A1H6TKI4_9BACL|nr:DUF2804 domain-containing protein [Bhargavaea ginsengi]SEI76750.1 Protein of unknown function [Bhargavaea ginsengi]